MAGMTKPIARRDSMVNSTMTRKAVLTSDLEMKNAATTKSSTPAVIG